MTSTTISIPQGMAFADLRLARGRCGRPAVQPPAGARMTPADLRAWQAHMGLTYDTAAKALGVSRATYAEWLAGKSRTTGKPVAPSRLCALACAALAAGLEPYQQRPA